MLRISRSMFSAHPKPILSSGNQFCGFRSTLAEANENQSQFTADFARILLISLGSFICTMTLDFDLENAVYALDATTDLRLSLFPAVPFCTHWR